jgi:hypothetical protein
MPISSSVGASTLTRALEMRRVSAGRALERARAAAEDLPEANRRAASAAGAPDRALVHELGARDREVRAHEAAHAAAGGALAGVPHYDYVTGPDGRRYAAGGEPRDRRVESYGVAPEIVPDEPRLLDLFA